MPERDFLYFPFDIDAFLLGITYSFMVAFSVDKIKLDFGFVVQIPKPAHHGCDFLNLFIKITVMSGTFINGLIKLKLPKGILLNILP